MNWRFDEHMRSISKCNTSTSFDIYGGIPLKGIWVFVRARMFEILNVSVGDASAKLTLTKNQLHQGIITSGFLSGQVHSSKSTLSIYMKS